MEEESVLGSLKRIFLGYNFIFLGFIILYRYCVFSKVCGNLCPASWSVPFFPNNFCSFYISVSQFGNFCSISSMFPYYYLCYGDLWFFLMLLLYIFCIFKLSFTFFFKTYKVMASPTPWTWVWASFRSWWWTGKPGML